MSVAVTMPARQGARIFHVDDAVPGAEELFGGQPWDEVFRGPAEAIRARFDVCVDAAAVLVPGFSVRPGLRLAVWCADPSVLERLRDRDDLTIVFSPNALAVLDAHRRARRTLVMARAVAKGEIITRDALADMADGQGLDAALADAVIGRAAAYDLAVGEALDFGKML